jgi:hypothetical protein
LAGGKYTETGRNLLEAAHAAMMAGWKTWDMGALSGKTMTAAGADIEAGQKRDRDAAGRVAGKAAGAAARAAGKSPAEIQQAINDAYDAARPSWDIPDPGARPAGAYVPPGPFPGIPTGKLGMGPAPSPYDFGGGGVANTPGAWGPATVAANEATAKVERAAEWKEEETKHNAEVERLLRGINSGIRGEVIPSATGL